MEQTIGYIGVDTPGAGLVMITDDLARWLRNEGARDGLLTLLCQHTSASLTIQENADPDVRLDLQDAISALAPHGGAERYRHHLEGPDDMAAHIRTVLSGVHLSIPVQAGRMMLGTWQGVYLWEHRARPQRRRIALHFAGTEDTNARR
ncbi:secondary thiamine-phosphate synthase enzyme YjbQ [Rhodobacteraceae bacterium NNCM2]|nr:secondary thiamine-phosphate synthase enzyme YjbQ [Coraliihabitans acroporae]